MQKDKEIIFDNKSTYSNVKGKLIISFMNLVHMGPHKYFVKLIDIKHDDIILDVGCGGGSLIKQIKKRTNKKVCGIDFSPDMVLASKRNNRTCVQKGIVEIKEASVSDIPYKDDTFDKLCVFETIQFWPDIVSDLKENHRVLKPKGTLHLMNRMPKKGSKWYDWCKLKNADQYRQAVEKAGFSDIDIDTSSKNGWIIVKARKS